jgi:NitT/TauT family transport system permease protein
MVRLASLLFFVAVWYSGSLLSGPRLLPTPASVAVAIYAEARSGALFTNLGITLLRVVSAFTLAMVLGSVIGFFMGRSRTVDRIVDPWVVVLLNIPALVIIVLCYLWGGLTEVAAICAVALNKLPNAIVALREGARTLDVNLDEMAKVFGLRRSQILRHVTLPQLAPYLAAAARSGLSLVWKIVLVVELLGRSNGVGFEVGVAFQLFDVTKILAYTCALVLVMLSIETGVVQPIERYAANWRR